MAGNELQVQAINVSSDIEDLLESYEIDDLIELGELNEFLCKIGDIKREFRRIHAQLKITEGDNYVKVYPDYEKQLKELNNKFNTANKKLSALKRADKEKLEEVERRRNELESEKIKQETDAIKIRAKFESDKIKEETEAIKIKIKEKRLQCKSEWKFFIEQVKGEITDCNWETFVECDELKVVISTFELRLEKFYKICSELEGNFGDQANEFGFKEENEKFVMSIREKINKGKTTIAQINEGEKFRIRGIEIEEERERKLAEINRIEYEKKQDKEQIDNVMICANNLYYEIKIRYETLKGKCMIDVSKLNDYEVLDLKKREDSFHTELRELIDKISSFVKFVLPCGDLASEMRDKVIEMRADGTKDVDYLLCKVQGVILENDISEKKLNNSAGLKLELPKFKGYYSEMNIYTFRSEFKKLIEPNVQKRLWSDYLKKNCLAGAAYNLVSQIEIIEDIWDKLMEVYGNTQLLFHNKISLLEKLSNLEKLKDDEKIAFTISSLLNIMADLSKLAQDYKLEGDLYHGGGLQKILELIGRFRERNFIRVISKNNFNNKEKWEKLVDFLKDELKEREAFILNEKVKKYMTLDSKGKGDSFLKENKKSEFGISQNFDNKKRGDMACKGYVSVISQNDENSACHICGHVGDHVISIREDGKPCIEYVACKRFVGLKPRERDQILFKKRFCNKCINPGVRWNSEHSCNKKYTCKQTYLKHGKEMKCEKHVLVCGYHANTKSNRDLLEEYKRNVIKAHDKYQHFSKEVSISCFADMHNGLDDSSIFAFQTIDVEGLKLNLFYDSGCGDLVVNKECTDELKKLGRAKQEFSGPVVLNGVGNQESICENGVYSISLPLENGEEAKMSGVCVENITVPFPKYPLKKVEDDFRKNIAEINSDILPHLPRLPNEVGGKVDIMIGKQYLKYFPKEIAKLGSGLTLYTSRFRSPDGSKGVIAGPHPEFTKTERMSHFAQDKKYIYLNPVVQKYNDMITLINDVPLLGNKVKFSSNLVKEFPGFQSTNSNQRPTLIGTPESELKSNNFDVVIEGRDASIGNEAFTTKRAPKCLKKFDKIENTGTNISYRCMDCRNCLNCLKGSDIEEISIQEEVEQNIINKSVTVDFEKRICTVKLPFIADPESRLTPNLKTARKVYDGQVRKLGRVPGDRHDVIESEGKLHELGYVDYLNNLNEADQKLILNSNVMYFIPWRVVWSKSLSTPIRLVFDASQSTPNGCSLNEILAKGANNMNNLVQILIRWTIRKWAFHTDIRKMYNAVQLNRSHWRYQLYLWEKDLDPKIEPQMKVIKTLIYGVKSSGNQAERAVRETAAKNIEEYPNAHDIILNDIYVDDCISGTHTENERMSVTDELKFSLGKGGFTLKGFSFSGEDPDDKLSADNESVNVGGLRWYPKDDYIMINVNKLNFAKKIRGRKNDSGVGIPEILTMRDCVGKVAELFEPLGKITPIVAGMKVDISLLHSSGLGWDDEIPSNLRNVWTSNFEMMEEIGRIKYKRAIVPDDAINLDIDTIDTGDASSKLICAAIYARFKKRDGTFSCQLVFARSKVLPEGISIPRAELMAAGMNAATGHTVKKAFGNYHKKALKLTDSLVALHWIASKRTTLKMWVRNRVVEINRICDASLWRYVESSNMVADLGTRKGAKISDVMEDSDWINGLKWMSKPEGEFPTFTVEQINLSQGDVEESKKEKLDIDLKERICNMTSLHNHNKHVDVTSHVNNEIKLRYQFSNYLIDPNRFRFRKVIRILGLVLTFIKKITRNMVNIQGSNIFTHKCPGRIPKILESNGDRYVVTTGKIGSIVCIGGQVIELTNEMLTSAMFYFSTKTTLEVKHFLSRDKFANITKEIDTVLYYSGRIPLDYSFGGYPELCEAAIDICDTTFCVPVMDQYSPVAISIAMEIHWYHPDVKHSGIEPMLRQTQRVAHIIGGRDLVKTIKRGCKKCRILNKASIDVVMGQIQNVNLCIAPAFYACQIDIFGPFKSYSNVNKRATVKVWFLVFCCCTTGGIDVRVMEDYSTVSFIQAFIRFSCRFGYPKFVLPDEGSQLVNGCENMTYSFTDSKQKLSVEYGVQYMACPVGAHYVHGKVERKIRQVKKCIRVNVENERLSIIQWETLMQQISNSINNLPIGLKNKVEAIENLDIITPNRLILGRNNERCPNAPLVINGDHKGLIECNAKIFKAWFKAWLISYVPSLIERPKWHKSDRNVSVGDVVLFLKSEREYDEQYQYGIISSVHKGQDGHIRRVDVEYQNYSERVKRTTQRGVRELVIIYPVDEFDIYQQLAEMFE